MKVNQIIQRYITIVGRLSNRKKATFEQIKSAVFDSYFNYDNQRDEFSQRTLQRNIKDIKELFGVEIKFNRKEQCYFIQNDNPNFTHTENKNLLNSFHLMNFEKYMKNVSDYIVYDNTYYKGNEYIFDIQNALSSNKLIEIDYRKYEESDTPKLRIVEPYGLREIEGRWYLWAKIQGTKDDFRVFGLDRIYKLEISGGSFKRQNISILNYFKDSIGTYVLGEEPVERVKLQINDFMYHYFRSYPVHHTQRFEKNDDGYLMEIRVQINTDLVNKIFQFGDQIRVIQPKALIKEIKNRLNLIAAYYD